MSQVRTPERRRMRGMCRSRRSAVSKSQLSKLVKRSRRVVRCSAKVMAARSEASWRARAPPTTTPGSHISREGMKPFTKPPKMTTSKVWPKRSSGAAMATAGTSGSEFLPHGAASFRIEDGAAAALSSHASLWRAEERDVTLAVTADAEELSAAESSAMSVSGWFSSLCSPSSRWATR